MGRRPLNNRLTIAYVNNPSAKDRIRSEIDLFAIMSISISTTALKFFKKILFGIVIPEILASIATISLPIVKLFLCSTDALIFVSNLPYRYRPVLIARISCLFLFLPVAICIHDLRMESGCTTNSLMCLDVCRSENLGMVVGGYESFVNELDIV
jgi:hypothetical protein